MKRRRSRFAPAEPTSSDVAPAGKPDEPSTSEEPSVLRASSFTIVARSVPSRLRRRSTVINKVDAVEDPDTDEEKNESSTPQSRRPRPPSELLAPAASSAPALLRKDSDDNSAREPASLGVNGHSVEPAMTLKSVAEFSKETMLDAAAAVDEEDPLDLYMRDIGASRLPNTSAVRHNEGIILEEEPEEADTFRNGEEVEPSGFLERSKRRRLVYERVDHSSIDYPPYEKELYHEVPELARMTHDQVLRVRRLLGNIRIRGKRCPKPIRSFGQCGLSASILDVIHRAGYESPTPIQAQAIPCVMSGRDVIGVAKTGSGKTLAFLLPVLRHISLQERPAPGQGPIALLVAPTRELATQIYGEAKRFSRAIDRRCACAYGGSGLKDQIADLKRGADIVVCTPGRMIDLLAMNSGRITNLRRVTIVVLDEADRMFDMGFEPQLTRLVENIRPDRQTVMFSATFPPQVERLARKILKHPVEIVVGGNSIASNSIDQHVEVRSEDSKFFRLLQLLGEWYELGATLVFVDRQENADRIYRELSHSGYQCLPLHGGMDQADRESALIDFKNGDIKVLVATSVAARGLDVKGLNLVVNYDVPNHYEDYVHRVGRTGRAGRAGTSYTFITSDQEAHAPDLVKALEMSARNGVVTEGLTKVEARELSDNAAQTAVPEELKSLAESFQAKQDAKRQAGEIVRNHNSGYGGRGFTFDENEESAQAALRTAQAKRFKAENDGMDVQDGLEFDGDGEALDDVEIKVIDRRKTSRTANGTEAGLPLENASVKASSGDDENEKRNGPVDDAEVKSMILAAEENARNEAARENLDSAQTVLRITRAKAQALTTIAKRNRGSNRASAVNSERTTLVPSEAVHEDQAMSAAAAAVAALSARLGKGAVTGSSGAPSGNSRSQAGSGSRISGAQEDEPRFEAELEINDYPQHARWRVTHANALVDVTENTGCVVTARGNFYPPGRNAPAGERKLHLLIEGEDERSVKAAWKEIKLKLEEAALARPDEKGAAYSKYSVV